MEIPELLATAVKHNVSDLHLFPESPPLFRIDGELIAVKEVSSLSAEEVKHLIYRVLSEDQQQAFETKLQLDTAISLPQIGHFRVSVFHQLRE